MAPGVPPFREVVPSAGRLPAPIDGVLARMAEIDAAAGGDGVGWFNALYAATTAAIGEAVRADRFEAPDLLIALDVAFAELYFHAWERRDAIDEMPRAWRPLFERRGDAIHPLQFAIAGMNAHINRDLPFAVVEAAAAAGVPVRQDTAFYRDFLVVNGILEATEARVKPWFSRGLVGEVDRALGDVDDRLALFSIVHARSTAWENAELLDGVRGGPLVAPFATALDRLVGLAGRAILLAP